MPSGPKTDVERDTTGEPYVEGNMETDQGVSPSGSSVEDLDAASDDAPDSLATEAGDTDDTADDLSIGGADEAPDSAP